MTEFCELTAKLPPGRAEDRGAAGSQVTVAQIKGKNLTLVPFLRADERLALL